MQCEMVKARGIGAQTDNSAAAAKEEPTDTEICLKCEGSYILSELKDRCVSILEWRSGGATGDGLPKITLVKHFVIEPRQ